MSEAQIYAAMAKVMTEVTAIAKDKNNPQQGFKYRGIDDVYNAINPVLAKNGIFMTSAIVSKERQERTNSKGTVLAFTTLRMRYSFWAPDGSHVDTEVEGEGMDSGDKSSNKAMAVAHKYALLQAFCVPTMTLDDPDGEGHEVAGKPGGAKPEAGHGGNDYVPTPEEIRAACNIIRKEIDGAAIVENLTALYAAKAKTIATIKAHDDDAYKALVSYFSARKASLEGKAA